MFRALLLISCCALSAGETTVLNHGHPGWNSQKLRDAFKPDLVKGGAHFVLYCGMNDSNNSKALIPLEKYKENVRAMLDGAKSGGAASITLVTIQPVVEEYVRARHAKHPAEDRNAYLATFDAAVREIAREKGALLADFRAALIAKGGATKEKDSLIRNEANSNTTDGVHPNAAGYRLLAETVYGVLKTVVKPGQTVVCYGDSITNGQFMKGAGTATGETYPAQLALLLNGK